MKRFDLFQITFSVLVGAVVVGGVAYAAASAVVTATVTVQSISMTMNQSTFSYGTMPDNSASSTLNLWGGVGITANNTGSPADFDILGALNTTGSGGQWTLDTATSTPDHFKHWFCNDTDNNCLTPNTNYTTMTDSTQTLKNNVGIAGAVAFQLQIGTPNPSTVYTEKSHAVTVQASAPN